LPGERIEFDNRLLGKIHGCLAGVAVGDAFGMPMAGYTPEEVRRRYGRVETLLKPVPDHPLHGSLPRGSITDDTQLTMAIVDMILMDGKLSRKGMADRIVKWVTDNRLMETRILGPSTIRAVQALMAGEDPSETGKQGTTNGGAMKIAPVGIINVANPLDRLIDDVEEVCMPTHYTGVAIAASAAVAAAVAEGLRPSSTIVSVLRRAEKAAKLGEERGAQLAYPSVEKRIKLAIKLTRNKELEKAAEILYTHIGADIASADAIPTAFGLFAAADGDPMTTIRLTANMGGDTDTIGAIAGGIAGAFSSIEAFPRDVVDYVDKRNHLNLRKKAEGLMMFAEAYR
jgi:ADP-ribosylglycohydrolase